MTLRPGAAARRGLAAFAAAALVAAAPAAPAAGPLAQSVPASGPLSEATVKRTLLLDAARVGQRLVAVGDRGFILYSDDQGAKWTRARAPEAPLLTAVHFLGEKLGYAVGHDAVILATSDRGETWRQVFAAASEQRPLLDVLPIDEQRAIAVGAYGAYYETTDGGKTWNARKVLADDKHLNAVVRAGGDHLVILGEAGTVLVSADLGATWKESPVPYKGSLFGALVAGDGALVAYGMRGRIFRSADHGATWKPVENASVAALFGGDRLPDGGLVLAGALGTALVSRDHGQSFQPVATGTTRALAKAILGAPNEIVVLGEIGARAVKLPSAPHKP